MTALVLPPSQLEQVVRLLQALDLYRLLSHDMMRRIGVASRDAIGPLAEFARRRKLIDCTPANLFSGQRKVPHLYWLTHKGAATLNKFEGRAADDEAIGAARRFGHLNEVMHRIGLVELHIAARAWCHAAGYDLDGFTVDFEPGSYGRQKKTAFKGDGWGYAPDGLAWVRRPGDAAPRLLVLELERGGEAGDLYPFFKHKLPHMRAVAAGEYVEDHFGLGAAARFLIVFGSHATKRDGTRRPLHQEALARWPDPADPVWDGFFIKSEDEATENFGLGWHQPGDRPGRDLFKAARAASST